MVRLQDQRRLHGEKQRRPRRPGEHHRAGDRLRRQGDGDLLAAASDPDGNLSGYILERQTDGGSWSQRYKGAGLSYADTVPFGTASVCYRVKAYDAENLSSGYTTSPTRSVVNAPDVPVLTAPELAMEGQTVPVSWTAATHAAGYTLERKASTDADWTQVYSGRP